MEKEELLKQLSDALANENEIRIVKVKYQNGEVYRFDFEELKVEVKNENEEEEEEEEEENEADEVDDDDKVKDTSTSNQTSYQGSTQTFQASGRKVNVINR